MNTSSLLIVGASARAAAQSARRGGFDVSAADGFADADLAAAANAYAVPQYPLDVVEAAGRFPTCDWLYVGGFENHPALIDAISIERRLLGIRGENLQRLRDPFDLQRVLRAAGHSFPETARELSESARNDDWLVKNRRSSGGLSVVPADLSIATPKSRSNAYYQRRVHGTPCGAIFIGDGARSRLLGVTEQLLSPSPDGRQPFRYGGSLGPLPMPAAVERQLTAIGELVAREYQAIGLFGVDFLLDEAGAAWPIEINPRYTAGGEILERATGQSLIARHVEACRQTTIDTSQVSEPSVTWHGKQVVYADNLSGKVPGAMVADLLSGNRIDRWPTVADIPAAGSTIVRGSPLVTVFATGPTREVVSRQLAERAAALQEDFRRAIY